MIYRGRPGEEPFTDETVTDPPHDHPGAPASAHLPRGPGSGLLKDLMAGACQILADHPVNQARMKAGKSPANAIWLWGQGKAPSVPKFRRAASLERGDDLGGRSGAGRGSACRVGAHRRPGRDGLSRHGLCGQRAVCDPGAREITTSSACTSRRRTRRATKGATRPRLRRSNGSTRTSSARCCAALGRYDRWRILISPDHSTLLRTRAHDRAPVAWAMAGTGLPASGQYV